MEELKATAIALVTVGLSVLIKGITLAMIQPNEIKNNLQQIYAVGFDLIMISLSILLGLFFTFGPAAEQHKRGRLFTPMVAVFVATILSFFLLAMSLSGLDWVNSHRGLITIWLPNLIGLASIALSIRAGLK